MNKADELKKLVTEKYSAIAQQGGSCCDETSGCGVEYSFIGDDYQTLDGYSPDADLGLGCGLPTEHAKIRQGDVVVDLGSGAGNDCFVARSLTGPQGKVIGLDFTPAMIAKAQENAAKLHYENVHFVQGDIENMPMANDTADVVVSNCVLNLVPDKEAAFSETFRILKPGGHFSISDVVIAGDLPPELQQAAELYAGCVSGAIAKDLYLKLIKEKGFTNITLQKEKKIDIPRETLESVLNPQQLAAFEKANVGIYSITVYGEKPQQPCCGTECCD